MPACVAMARAVRVLSPVSMIMCLPSAWSALMACGVVSLSVSATAMMPVNLLLSARSMTVFPSCSSCCMLCSASAGMVMCLSWRSVLLPKRIFFLL